MAMCWFCVGYVSIMCWYVFVVCVMCVMVDGYVMVVLAFLMKCWLVVG